MQILEMYQEIKGRFPDWRLIGSHTTASGIKLYFSIPGERHNGRKQVITMDINLDSKKEVEQFLSQNPFFVAPTVRNILQKG
jgi:hypothetical protein